MISKINGYSISDALSIALNGDYSTSSSFEAPADVNPVFSRAWPDGVVEYDLSKPPTNTPRVFTLSGYISVQSEAGYKVTRTLIDKVIKQNYVTLEDDSSLQLKVNARLRPGSIKWTRKTPLSGKVVVELSFQLDEVLQPMPYKDEGIRSITYLIDSEGKFIMSEDNKFMIL